MFKRDNCSRLCILKDVTNFFCSTEMKRRLETNDQTPKQQKECNILLLLTQLSYELKAVRHQNQVIVDLLLQLKGNERIQQLRRFSYN